MATSTSPTAVIMMTWVSGCCLCSFGGASTPDMRGILMSIRATANSYWAARSQRLSTVSGHRRREPAQLERSAKILAVGLLIVDDEDLQVPRTCASVVTGAPPLICHQRQGTGSTRRERVQPFDLVCCVVGVAGRSDRGR